MTTLQQIAIAEQIIKTGLVTKVFHSCQLLSDDQKKLYPAYQRGAEFTYTGIDDAKGLFAYIRNNGDLVGVPLKIQSCSRSYDMAAPLRVVFFNDNEDRNHEDLITKLAPLSFLTGVTLQRIITDKYRLVREESDIFRERFDGKTFYVAFDLLVAFLLLPSTCPTNVCETFVNPVTTCPAAVQTSTSSATS